MQNTIKAISTAIKNNSYDDIRSILSNCNVEWSKSKQKIIEKPIVMFRNTSINEVLACVILYSHFGGDEGIDFARKRGLFAYYFNWDGTERVLKWLIENYDLLNFSDEAKTYLKHKYGVRWLRDFYRNCDTEIDALIDEHERQKRIFDVNGATIESNTVVELLTLLELLFWFSKESKKTVAIELSKTLDYDFPDYYSLEELSEAVSYVISRCCDKHGYDHKNLWLNVSAIKENHDLADIILLAARRKLIVEWEISIDYYGYDIEQVEGEDGTLYRIVDKKDYEKSIQLGFIKTSFQEQARNMSYFKSPEECMYLYNIADELRKYPDLLLNRVDRDTELERYRMEFPKPLLIFLMPKDYDKPDFFMEERVQIDDAAHEMLLSFEEILTYKITDLCTVKDIILFKRFFTLVSYTQQFLAEKHEDDLEVIAKSIVPCFRKDNLIQLLKFFVGDVRKAEDLLKLCCWEGKGILDIQSTPIIKLNRNQYFVVPFVLTSSNLIRNVIVKERKAESQKTNSNGVEEPLERFTKKLFDYHKDVFKHREQCKFIYKGQAGEIDLIAWTDDHLYLIECKNSILPTSPFELRTTYDYILKAERQLDLSSVAFADDKTKKQLLNNWDIPVKDYEVHTLILLGNRIFTVPNGFHHQVRYIHELYMVFTGGVINSSFGKWRYWKNKEFIEEDFLRFISKDDPMENDFLKALKPYKMVISCGDYKIERESYSLNIVEHWELDDENLINLSTDDDMQMRAEYRKKHDGLLSRFRTN